jgi:hypothetical protein
MHKNSLNIPISLRVLVIIQLCIGLSCLIWLIGYPFMGGHFTLQSELILIESVMGQQETLIRLDSEKSKSQMDKIQKNHELFNLLPEKKKKEIENLFLEKKLASKSSFFEKIEPLLQIPRLEVLWILAAVAIPILILLRNRQAALFVWLLPIICSGYALNNQINGLDPLSVSDRKIFPREETLPISSSLAESWEHYLEENWDGEYYFNLSRVELLPPSLAVSFWEKRSPLILICYLLWNLNFAWRVTRQLNARSRFASHSRRKDAKENKNTIIQES